MVAATKLQIAELFEYSHSDRMAAESAEDVGAADEVEHELLRAQVCDADLRSKVTVSLAHHDRAGKPDPANDQRNEWMGRGGELATGMHCWIKKCIVQCVLFSENKETRVPLACLLVQVIISTSLLLRRALRADFDKQTMHYNFY